MEKNPKDLKKDKKESKKDDIKNRIFGTEKKADEKEKSTIRNH
jgi:hypothetical protein